MSFFPFFFFSPLSPILFFFILLALALFYAHIIGKNREISLVRFIISLARTISTEEHTRTHTHPIYTLSYCLDHLFFFLFIYLGTVLFENVYNEAFFFSSSFFGKRGKGKFNEKQKKKRKKSNGRIGNEIGTLVSM